MFTKFVNFINQKPWRFLGASIILTQISAFLIYHFVPEHSVNLAMLPIVIYTGFAALWLFALLLLIFTAMHMNLRHIKASFKMLVVGLISLLIFMQLYIGLIFDPRTNPWELLLAPALLLCYRSFVIKTSLKSN